MWPKRGALTTRTVTPRVCASIEIGNRDGQRRFGPAPSDIIEKRGRQYEPVTTSGGVPRGADKQHYLKDRGALQRRADQCSS